MGVRQVNQPFLCVLGVTAIDLLTVEMGLTCTQMQVH